MKLMGLSSGVVGVACAMVVGMAASPAWGLAGGIACPLAGDAYANPPDQVPHGASSFIAIRSDTNGFDVLAAESADIAATGGVTGVCWWGFYISFGSDCGADMPGDDGNSFTELERSDFDGLGQYREEVRRGSFAGSVDRTTHSELNSARGEYAVDANGQAIGTFTPMPSTCGQPLANCRLSGRSTTTSTRRLSYPHSHSQQLGRSSLRNT